MSDVFSKAKRSEVMARIRSRGNKATEIEFLKLLRRHRISGWRRHLPLKLVPSASGTNKIAKRSLQVKPDFVFRVPRLAVFIDGCFWHGCPRHGTTPTGNAEFWFAKLSENKKRDRYVNKMLRRQKWTVFRFWEHQLSHSDMLMMELKRRIDQMACEAPRIRETSSDGASRGTGKRVVALSS